MSTEVTNIHIHNLLELFAKNAYRAKDSEEGSQLDEIMEKCLNLFQLDYNTVEISNQNGELSSHYPSLIVIPENEKEKEKQKPNGLSSTSTNNGSITPPPILSHGLSNANVTANNSSQRTQQTIYENSYDPTKLRDLMKRARIARSRTRFPVPVILYKGKFVCRSSTLSGGPELYTRSSFNFLFAGGTSMQSEDADFEDNEYAIEVQESFASQEDGGKVNSDWPLFDQVRSQDIRLLKTFNVGTIVDFMVEKKKVKFGLKVTSSEKVDKENRYSDFTLVSLPYPGCEFFRAFRDNNYTHENLVFDWTQTHVNAEMALPDDITKQMQYINWEQYKAWDLVTITQNYLRLCLKYLQDNSSGLLIHCISGWDRTPLFISLLRLSLWADGAIHQSLNAMQILFLTLAYDWFLFGHDLPDRLTKGEDIFFFCFYALKYIQEEEFSLINHCFRHRSKHNSSGSSVVMHQDSESNSENLQFEVDSHGSSISLSSGGSQQDICIQKLSTNDSHENTNGNVSHLFNQDSNSSIEILSETPTTYNYSPISKRRTSPVSVPHSSVSRPRLESTSSVGSWQLVNQSGSLRSTDSHIHNVRANNMQESNATLVDEEAVSCNHIALLTRRRDRLQSVRNTFNQLYFKACGIKYKNGELTSLGSMLGNFAERVGFSQRT